MKLKRNYKQKSNGSYIYLIVDSIK